MSSKSTYIPEKGPSSPQPTYDTHPPTIAAFSPSNISGSSIASKQRSTIIVHKKSPLLVATPQSEDIEIALAGCAGLKGNPHFLRCMWQRPQ